MSTAVATVTDTPRRSVLVAMATRYDMEPAAFEQTLRHTVVPKDTSREEFAAFLVVANEYGLNPLTKEIYAFPKKGGGIQPIVSIDGWCNLINSHPKLNGIDFDDHLDAAGNVRAITARLWRKDREKPIVVTEYMAECLRATEPWQKWPRRMLRHKALIQCARYAFGFAGIVDPDEAERLGTDVSPMRDVTPPTPPPAPQVASPPTQTVEWKDEDGGEPDAPTPPPPPEPPKLPTPPPRQQPSPKPAAQQANPGGGNDVAPGSAAPRQDQTKLPGGARDASDAGDIPPGLDRRTKKPPATIEAQAQSAAFDPAWRTKTMDALASCESDGDLWQVNEDYIQPAKGLAPAEDWQAVALAYKRVFDQFAAGLPNNGQTIIDAG